MITIKNSLSAMYIRTPVPQHSGQIITVPDLTLTIQEILYRHGKGMPLDVSVRTPNFDPENYTPDPGRLDLVDRHDYLMQFGEELQQIKQRQSKRKAENDALKAKEAAKRKEIEEYYLAHKKASEEAKNGQ